MSNSKDFESLHKEMRGASPIRSSLLLLTILTFLGAAIFWAMLTEIDNVTRGDGRVVPSGRNQVIQSSETGVLQALFVREGDVVEEGDVLMELDPTLMNSQLAQEEQRAAALRAQITRLQALISGKDTLQFADDIIANAPSVVTSETNYFFAQKQEAANEIAVFDRQRSQRAQEYEEGVTDVQIAQETLALLDEEIAIMEPLVERRIEPEISLLALRRSRAEWQGRRVSSQSALIRLQAAMDEVDDRVRAYQARIEAEALSEFSTATAELAELQTRLPALRQRVERSELRAPVRGIVNQISLTTIGGLAQAGDPLIEIVPLDGNVLIEAYVRPSDIAFLYPDQPVKVKITAYDFSRYGALEGNIIRIGADAETRSDRDEDAFSVLIRTKTDLTDAAGEKLSIVPGMVAEVDILAGKKTVVQYLTQPVLRVKERALQE